MNICEFTERVKSEIQKLYEGERRLIIKNVPGNNGIVHVGISPECKNQPKIPTVYLDTFYESFLAEKITISDVAKNIYDTFHTYETLALPDISFDNFEKVKDKVVYRLVNYERNQTLLKDIPYIICCDLAIIFCLLTENNENDCTTALIHNNHMVMWKTDINVLYELAKENTPRLLPFSFYTMPELLKDISQNCKEHDLTPSIIENTMKNQLEHPLYILTNAISIYGAAAILYDGVLKDISRRIRKDLIILPSSIHEVLLVPYKNSISITELRTMVKDINAAEVLPEEVLSDTVYWYSRKTNRISIASEKTVLPEKTLYHKK